MNPISLCIITKNDPNIVACVASLRPYVKEVVIVDTGSTPENQQIAFDLADVFEVYTECNDPVTGLIADFSNARNRCFEDATQPWILWADSDDIVEGGQHLQSIISQYYSTVSIMFPYEYAYHNGKPILTQYRERLFLNKENFEWRSPVHEVCCAKSNIPQVERTELVWKHQRQFSNKSQESGRNLRILKKYVEQIGETDVRQLFYLAQEYKDNGDIVNAIKYYSRYVELSHWPDEQVQACLSLAELTKDIKWSFKAIEIKPNWCEGYLSAGKLFYDKNNWQSCVDFIQLGLSKPPTETVLFVNKSEREFEIHKYLNFALNNLNRVEEALASCQLALTYQDDQLLQQNKKCYENHLGKLSGPLNIVFALGDGLQTWNSESVKQTGIGGSELMAIHMSEGLAKLGHHVTIYNSCGHKTILNGVVYQPTANLKNHRNCDVLIVSRYSYFLASIQAKKKLLWVHDVLPQYLTPELYKLADKVLVLSEWHKQNVMKIDYVKEDKILVTRNGIDLNRFDKSIQKEPFRCINSSSPERSWNTLLDCWPDIKAKVPQATLNLFYGFDDLLKSETNIPLVNNLQNRIKELQSLDVVYHGRVNQERLGQEFMKSSVWLYPTLFLETYCIGAAEAQAAGCHMVTSNLAALNETAKNAVLIPFGHAEYNKMFVEAAVVALNITESPHYKTQDFDLDSLIESWNNILYNL